MESCDAEERRPWFDGVIEAFYVEDPDPTFACLRIDPVPAR